MKNRIHWLVYVCFLVLAGTSLAAQEVPLNLSPSAVRVEAREDGYHLFVKAVPGLSSLMLTEAFELPDHRLATYALRSLGPTAVGSTEQRLLDGKFLTQPHNSIVSSTPKADALLGMAYELLLPPVIEYGNRSNPNSRWGQVKVKDLLTTPGQGFWFSIRAFAKPYADYSGAYHDNAFELKTLLVQTSVPSGNRYEKGLVEGFSRLGDSYQATDIQDALGRIVQTLSRPGDTLDLVLAIDTTKSMVKNLRAVKENLLGPIREQAKKFKTFRIALVFYRDYLETYLTKTVAFQTDIDAVQSQLDKAVAEGGGDIPEAVVEALYAGLSEVSWSATNRVLLALGDAPQHPSPRGSVTEAQMLQLAQSKKVEIQLILLPQTIF